MVPILPMGVIGYLRIGELGEKTNFLIVFSFAELL
jgi:hypothetical protein